MVSFNTLIVTYYAQKKNNLLANDWALLWYQYCNIT